MDEKDFNIEDALKDAFIDECKGVIEYIEMSEKVGSKYPNKGYSQIFRDISQEERIHKNHLKDIIVDMGIEMTDDMKASDSESEEAFKSYFC